MTAAAHTLHRRSVGWRKGHRLGPSRPFGSAADARQRKRAGSLRPFRVRGITAL
ncbi:hypothetical protein [Azospirillum argentinense]